jgi:hypothetical protein
MNSRNCYALRLDAVKLCLLKTTFVKPSSQSFQALPANFRTLVTSRPHLSVGSQFPECKTVVIRAVDEDVRRYLEGRMSVLGKCVRLNVKLQKEIADSIARTVDGM